MNLDRKMFKIAFLKTVQSNTGYLKNSNSMLFDIIYINFTLENLQRIKMIFNCISVGPILKTFLSEMDENFTCTEKNAIKNEDVWFCTNDGLSKGHVTKYLDPKNICSMGTEISHFPLKC